MEQGTDQLETSLEPVLPPLLFCLLSSSLIGMEHGKESACNAGDLGSIPELGRSPGGGHGHPLQYSCLENPMERGTWWAKVREVTKSQT